ncbi:MAG TPA: hypothetical protein VK358_02340, partial [Longimicrobium sp.]|nr:hypothetical protein [Longimicrobium sp.]
REQEHMNHLEAYRNRIAELGQVAQGIALAMYADVNAQIKLLHDVESGTVKLAKGKKMPSRRDISTLTRAANQAAATGLLGEGQAHGVEELLLKLDTLS